MKLLIYLSTIMIAGSAHAQITISSFKPVSAGNVDSCYVPTPAGLASLPLFAPTTNATWNLSTVAIQAAPVVYSYKSKTSGFPGGTYIDSNAVTFAGGSANITYNTWNNIQQTSSAVNLLGDEIIKRQAKPLGSITMNSIDSIVFAPQAIVYSRSLPMIKFPATMGSTYGIDSSIRILNFNLTVTAASLNNAPGQHVQRIKTVDSIVGWGQMKVPIAGKIGSAWINVLQVHHYEIAVDSFYLNGSPASSIVLASLGLSQGQTTTTAKTNFLRANAVRPLLEAVHSTSSHSSSITRAYLNAIDLPQDLSVATSNMGSVRVYPNPVRNGQLWIDAPSNAGNGLHYQLINITGQQILQGIIGATGGKIQLPAHTAPGICFLTLGNVGQEQITVPVDVQ